MTKFQIGDIVKGYDDGKSVFGYVLEYTDIRPKYESVMVRWFDGYDDTDSLCKQLIKVTNVEDLDRIEDW